MEIVRCPRNSRNPVGPTFLSPVTNIAPFVLLGYDRTVVRNQPGSLMNVSVGKRWEGFVAGIVDAGRYGSASEVVREGLRLVEEREARLIALRETVNASIERGGSHTSASVRGEIASALDQHDGAARR